MARPQGSKNIKKGKTFFFTINQTGKLGDMSKQIAVHKDTTGHIMYQVYLDGVPQGNMQRIKWQELADVIQIYNDDYLRRLFDCYGRWGTRDDQQSTKETL